MSFEIPKNPNRSHDQSHFFKYTSASAAKTILTNQTLKWSSPLEFNDPFDVPREIARDVDPIEIAKGVGSLFVKQLFKMGAIFKNDPESKDKLLGELSSDLEKHPEVFSDFASSLADLRENWRNLIPELRILCLSENRDNSAMWYHYAEKLTGVVFRLEASDFFDSPLLLARPVRYQDELPSLEQASNWVKGFMGAKPFGPREMFREYCYVKTRDWRSENEWRVVSFARDDEVGMISFYPFRPATLTEICLGPEISETDREDLLAMLKFDFSNTRPYQAVVSEGNRIAFKEISNAKN